ncbi:hypothetical protein ACOXXX_10595 [Thalassococcus sp. BH17M4-6]|uniref:hypothetical protein n=1 Tax=Thalassococcus sp. BH17M4-6 TaxID=3413148 RepID=UPI003BCCC89E
MTLPHRIIEGRSTRPTLSALRRRIGRLQASSYDVANICNLTCEGCLYFARASTHPQADGTDLKWDALFRAEARRGVNFAYLAGAEPSMVPNRLRAAWTHIGAGVVFTNGTRRIADDLGFRIHVSLWGIGDSSAELRGADVNAKAFRNYAGDPRAVFVFTINAHNTKEIVPAAAACAAHGVPLTYSYFSPTDAYQSHVQSTEAERTDYLRLSAPDYDLRHTPESLAAARAQIVEAMALYPDTVRYSLHYNDWISRPIAQLWDLDADGVAINCGTRSTETHRHHGSDATRHTGKCCSPNIDCRECRAYAMAFGTYVSRQADFSGNRREFAEWVDGVRLWFDLFMPTDLAAPPGTEAAQEKTAASEEAAV